MILFFRYSMFVIICLLSIGCSASYHARSTQSGLDGNRLTVAAAQRDIKKGMSGSQVLEVLGSPNIISTDENGLEVWVYDKVATDQVHSSGGGVWTLGLAGGVSSSGAKSTSQRTLTIIVKFDKEAKVRDLAYHSSRF